MTCIEHHLTLRLILTHIAQAWGQIMPAPGAFNSQGHMGFVPPLTPVSAQLASFGHTHQVQGGQMCQVFWTASEC